jgi:AAA+ ATPase superfamily predicted ATPase
VKQLGNGLLKALRKVALSKTISRKKKYMTIARCKKELKEKIKNNVTEYNNGEKWVNRAQSIAAAYGQVQKKHPSCKKHLKKSN